MTKEEALKKFKARKFSWSSMNSFKYNPESWYRNYILDEKFISEELKFGDYIDKKIQNDPKFLPKLPRYEKMQHRMVVNFCGIELVGVPDGVNFKKCKEICDYKTGKIEWTQRRAEETGQLLFYLLLLYITEKIKPEEFTCYIYWLPTQVKETGNFERVISFIKEDDIRTFKVKHTMKDILIFGNEIISTYKKMEKYVEEYS